MFCLKCGKPIDMDKNLCDECAALVQAQATAEQSPEAILPAEQPAEVAAPVEEAAVPELQTAPEATAEQPIAPEYIAPEVAPAAEIQPEYIAPPEQPEYIAPPEQPEALQDSIVLEQDFGKPQKQKKSRVGLVIGILAAVAAAAVLAVVLCWGSLKGLWLKNFGAPEDYMLYVEEQALAKGVGNFAEKYSTYLNTAKKNTSGAIATGTSEVQLQLSETALTLLEQNLSQQGVDADLSFLKEVSLKTQAATNGDMVENTVTICLDGAEIAQLQQYTDPENNRMLIGLPGLAQGFAELPVDSDAQISMAQLAKLYRSLPSAEVTSDVINTYMGIVLKYMKNVEKETEILELDDIEQKMTVLTMKFTHEDLLDMIVEIMETAQEDEDLEEFLDDLSDYFNGAALLTNGYLTEEINLYASLMREIPGALSRAEELKDNDDFSKKTYMKLTDYVNSNHEICGRTISLHSEELDTPVSIHYLTVNKGDSYATEFLLSSEGASIGVEGSYTIEDGLRSGSYDISVDGEEQLTLEFTDCNAQQFHIKLMPSEEIIDDSISGGAGALVSLASPGFELSGKLSDNGSSLKLAFTMGGQDYASITMDTVYEDLTFSQLPDGPYADATDYEDMEEWAASINMEALFQKLIDAGVPEELLEELMYQLVMYM